MENVSLPPIVVIHMIMSETEGLVAPLMQTTNLIHTFFFNSNCEIWSDYYLALQNQAGVSI